MSITKNVFTLNKAYQLINEGTFAQYNFEDQAGVWVWGRNGCFSIFDFNNNASYTSPTYYSSNTWVHVSTLGQVTHGIKTDNTLWVWGGGGTSPGAVCCGIIGLGVGGPGTFIYCSPTQIGGTQWKDLSGIGNTTRHALKTDGTLWGWGQGGNGVIGNNTANPCNPSPVQIPGSNWSILSRYSSSSGNHQFAIKTDGTLWGWGSGANGQIGDGTTTSRSSPTQVPGTSWTVVERGNTQSYGLKSDGTLWTWGTSPTQVPGTQWVDVRSLNYSGYSALKNDNTLWVAGVNTCGRLGLNSAGGSIPLNSPVQLPGSWACIFESTAKKTDGTFWVWGLGAVNLTSIAAANTSSPVQLPGDRWRCTVAGAASLGSAGWAWKTE